MASGDSIEIDLVRSTGLLSTCCLWPQSRTNLVRERICLVLDSDSFSMMSVLQFVGGGLHNSMTNIVCHKSMKMKGLNDQ